MLTLETRATPTFKQIGIVASALTLHHQTHLATDEMKKFVENYAEFKKMAGNVPKHVAVMSDLSRVMDNRSLRTGTAARVRSKSLRGFHKGTSLPH